MLDKIATNERYEKKTFRASVRTKATAAATFTSTNRFSALSCDDAEQQSEDDDTDDDT